MSGHADSLSTEERDLMLTYIYRLWEGRARESEIKAIEKFKVEHPIEFKGVCVTAFSLLFERDGKLQNPIIRRDVSEFHGSGIIQEANRLFFHPRCLALSVVRFDGPSGEVFLQGIEDHREHGIYFGHSLDRKQAQIRRDKIEASEAMLKTGNDTRHKNREIRRSTEIDIITGIETKESILKLDPNPNRATE